MRAVASSEEVTTGGAWSDTGDLLRALRLRSQLTQQQAAAMLGIHKSAVARWESGNRSPTEEQLQRLCAALRALPEEQQALETRRLLPGGKHDKTLDECAEEVARFEQAAKWLTTPLIDLQAFALKRQLCLYGMTHPEARLLLTKVELDHASWLCMQDRESESRVCLQRVVSTMSESARPKPYWGGALNLAFYQASRSPDCKRAASHLLRQWLPHLPPNLQSQMLCDAALAAGQERDGEEAQCLLREAERLLGNGRVTDNEKRYYQITRARLQMALTHSESSLQWLLSQAHSSVERLMYQVQWLETLLAAGEAAEVARCLREWESHMPAAPPRRFQRRLDGILARL